MNTETTELLRELAEKLGTTVEYLWPQLVLNVQADWCGTFGVGALLCLFAAPAWRLATSADWGNPNTRNLSSLALWGIAIAGGLTIVDAIGNIGDIVAPEATALKQLIDLAR
jgi:hypothetical protein